MKKYSELERDIVAAPSGLLDAEDVLAEAFPPERRPASSPVRSGRWTLSLGPDGTNWLTCYRRRVALLDITSALVAVALAALARFQDDVPLWYVPLGIGIALAWVPVVYLCHGYEERFLGAGVEEYRALARAALLLLAVVSFGSFAFKAEVARWYVTVLIPLTLLLSLLLRRQVRRWLARQREAGRCLQRTVVVGHAKTSAELINQLEASQAAHTLEIVAVCASQNLDQAALPPGVALGGDVAKILDLVDDLGASVVAVANDPKISGYALRQLAWELEERGVELLVSPGIFEVAAPRLSIRSEASVLLLHVDRPITRGVKVALKRTMDRGLALLITMALLPVLAALALAVRLTSPGPVFFRQTRVGTRGRLFEMIKFRSMVQDAELLLTGVKDGHEVNDVLFKMADDPRVTRLGSFLRRFSLDELPQLFNVIRGDMSLVGPRPPLPREVTQYEQDAFRRLRVQPGMTGLWQVSGRSNLNWEQSLRLDLWYVDNWSPMLDLQILWRTARAVMGGTGAY